MTIPMIRGGINCKKATNNKAIIATRYDFHLSLKNQPNFLYISIDAPSLSSYLLSISN